MNRFLVPIGISSGRSFAASIFLASLVGLGIPPQHVTAQSPMTVQVQSGGTSVPIASELTSILDKGGAPKTLQQFKLLERQQRKVASAAKACTVSVQIGPAQGCGVIVTGTGYILTAAHVAMRPNKTAEITLSDGRKVTATTYGMNRFVDAGLIKINSGQNGGNPWPHATLGTSEQLVPGMWCVATGHPGGYDRSRGPVARVGRILAVRDTSIVTDCALIGGDSGGPLFDLAGRLIAVHSRIGNDVSDNLHVQIDHYDASWDRLVRRKAWGHLDGFQAGDWREGGIAHWNRPRQRSQTKLAREESGNEARRRYRAIWRSGGFRFSFVDRSGS